MGRLPFPDRRRRATAHRLRRDVTDPGGGLRADPPAVTRGISGTRESRQTILATGQRRALYCGLAFALSLQHEDGDLPRRQRLQFDVGGISIGSPVPPLFSLSAIKLAGRQLEHLVAVLDGDL